jgi:hypothetical protein
MSRGSRTTDRCGPCEIFGLRAVDDVDQLQERCGLIVGEDLCGTREGDGAQECVAIQSVTVTGIGRALLALGEHFESPIAQN